MFSLYRKRPRSRPLGASVRPVSDWLPEPTSTAQAAPAAPAVPLRNLLITSLCVVLVATCLAWTFLAMRAVMGVGGSCASGQTPYQISTPCPDGTWLMAVGIPVMIIAALVGSGFASGVEAPNLLLPMWAVLFASLGWNFLEYAVRGDLDWGFLVCGVLFEAMAAPALWVIGGALVTAGRRKRQDLSWFATYAFLGACGAFLGVATYAAAS